MCSNLSSDSDFHVKLDLLMIEIGCAMGTVILRIYPTIAES